MAFCHNIHISMCSTICICICCRPSKREREKINHICVRPLLQWEHKHSSDLQRDSIFLDTGLYQWLHCQYISCRLSHILVFSWNLAEFLGGLQRDDICLRTNRVWQIIHNARGPWPYRWVDKLSKIAASKWNIVHTFQCMVFPSGYFGLLCLPHWLEIPLKKTRSTEKVYSWFISLTTHAECCVNCQKTPNSAHS